MEKRYFIYIMTNEFNTVLYTGVTNNLQQRVFLHRKKQVQGFTRCYNLTKLVYYETFTDVYNALSREKQIKGGSRQKKLALVQSMNPKWEDLYDKL